MGDSYLKKNVALNAVIMLYSTSSIFSKNASAYSFFDYRFYVFYGGMIAVLAIYAILWQQIIKYIPLGVAYANKAFSIAWGMLWGVLIFDEKLSAGKCIGAAIVIGGVLWFSLDNRKNMYE